MADQMKQSRALNKRRTALCIATAAVTLAVVFEVRSIDRESSLLSALENKDLAAATVQLTNGADPNVRVPQYWPSHQLSDRLSFLQYKLVQPKQYYDYPILLAEVLRRDEASVKLLLSHGADPNLKMPDGITALRIARNSGDTRIVELLQQSGAR